MIDHTVTILHKDGMFAAYAVDKGEVTNMTLWQALPNDFKCEIANKGQQIKFAEETLETAKTKRADCAEIRRCFPIETSMLERLLGELTLNDYVIFKVQ